MGVAVGGGRGARKKATVRGEVGGLRFGLVRSQMLRFGSARERAIQFDIW